ncbi:uncharacterized protein LOC129225159 [Uloborus diversus]|uniref:uncharacterized protein LOC129225159 n=1 Tax=Uloborus diversus TaxID=327109 RepID=UPI002409D499|nr:uncharacterized protein LOC129225159 [Uloborus diversus]
MRCQPDFHFNSESERCMSPCEAKCDKHLDCKLKNKKSEFHCPSDDGRYGDPYDCSIYHVCSNSKHKIKRCKRGKYFDNARRQCTGRKRARCLYQCQKRKGRFPHPKQCDKFIHCRGSKAVVKSCPAGKAFAANKQECIRIEETDCGKNELLHILEYSGSIESHQ